jgi:hypothetical protein
MTMNMQLETADWLRTLPPLVAALAWDVLNDHVTPQTVELAQKANEQEYREFDLVRMLSSGNPRYPDLLAKDGKILIEMMFEDMAK